MAGFRVGLEVLKRGDGTIDRRIVLRTRGFAQWERIRFEDPLERPDRRRRLHPFEVILHRKRRSHMVDSGGLLLERAYVVLLRFSGGKCVGRNCAVGYIVFE